MKPIEIDYLSSIEAQIRFRPISLADREDSRVTERRIFLLGTAHVSEQSARQTEEKIAELKPDCICIELDRQRYENLMQQERWQNLDLFQTLKEGKGLLLLINLLLASFQRRVSRDLNMKPGQEMICAVELAHKNGINLELVDRPVEITLKRAWAACNFGQRVKLLSGLVASLTTNEKISEEDIENLKEANTLEHLMNEFATYLPSIKSSLIDERDVFLARSILAAPGQNVFAVLGAGHLRGVCQVMELIAAQESQQTAASPESRQPQSHHAVESVELQSAEAGKMPGEPQKTSPESQSTMGKKMDANTHAARAQALRPGRSVPIPQTEELLLTPNKSNLTKILPWVLPAIAVGIMLAGFVFSDTEKALQGIGIWILSHSVLAGLTALLVLAHPLSILVAIIASPFTALNPSISVGLLTALCEVLLRKPRIKDIEDLLELEKWWQFRQNRIWHALIIFVGVSLGGAAATFIALPWLSVILST